MTRNIFMILFLFFHILPFSFIFFFYVFLPFIFSRFPSKGLLQSSLPDVPTTWDNQRHWHFRSSSEQKVSLFFFFFYFLSHFSPSARIFLSSSMNFECYVIQGKYFVACHKNITKMCQIFYRIWSKFTELVAHAFHAGYIIGDK